MYIVCLYIKHNKITNQVTTHQQYISKDPDDDTEKTSINLNTLFEYLNIFKVHRL